VGGFEGLRAGLFDMKNEKNASWRVFFWRRVRIMLLLAAIPLTPSASAQTIRVDTSPAHAISFDPDLSLGSSMDILPTKLVDTVYSEVIVKESLSAGWGPISYRQNAELTIAAWHWNPNGTWSDPSHQSGYFTGSAEPKDFLRHSYGYALPHRGDTRSDAAQGKYSRLADGDLATYWKSNPYLTKKFTGEEDARHPQWIVLDFGTPQDIDAIRIHWGNPYAKKYLVQYWIGEDAFEKPTAGVWALFPAGEVTDGTGGTVLMRLSEQPMKARVNIEFADANSKPAAHFLGPVEMVTFGAEQYVWHSDGPKSHADPDDPPAKKKLNVKSGDSFELPKASVTVLRGKVG